MDSGRFHFLSSGRSQPNLSAVAAPRREYPTSADEYELLEECGRGVSATVWRAAVRRTGEIVAVKELDLENMNCSLEEIVREAQTMRSLHHPNLLPLYCSFVHEQHLWMVMPYVQGGSVLNIMRFRFHDGLEEPAIATIMREVLKALEYLHRNGIIHRDIKAGNILLGSDGHVLLADFGVAATLERGGSWGNRMVSRNTFVGTPCWMAPEVMQQECGYDARADIWSFGITLLELAHGHAPFARLPPMKVLIMTLQNPPPTLDQTDSKKHFSKAMRDIVAKCLVKDPKERPTAAQLLEHKFFKTAHDAHYLQRHVLDGLPSVPERVEMMRAAHSGPGYQSSQDHEILASQQEYRRGVSSWNFDVAALKAAAAKADAERLPVIAESSSDLAGLSAARGDTQSLATEGGLTHRVSDMSTLSGAASEDSSPSKVTSPTGAAIGPTPGKNGAAKAPGIKEQGRFKVYEGGDEPPPFSPPNGGGALMEEGMKARQLGTPSGSAIPLIQSSEELEGEAGDKAKRKGRFRYVEEDGPDGAKGRGVAKSTSQATLGAMDSRASLAGGAPATPSVAVMLTPLKGLLEMAVQQQEVLREAVAALGDAEKGKNAALNAFLQQHVQPRAPREEFERLRGEVAELREENAKLKEKLRVLDAGGK